MSPVTIARSALRPMLGLGLAALGISACAKKADTAPASTAPVLVAPAPADAPAPPPPAPEPAVQDGGGDEAPLGRTLASIETLSEAIDFTRALMSDEREKTSKGAFVLAAWAMGHMKWSDVGVAKGETSFALVMKDPEEARGKRFCTAGNIVQIAVERVGADKLATGLVYSDGGNLVHYIAVGSTGELVQRSRARYCGVVIGRYDYSNSGGGTGHAVQMVGMFDLPENRKNRN